MRIHRWILTVASRLVPKAMRDEWRAEWDAELQHRETSLRAWRTRGRGRRLDLVRRSIGAFWDALWLRSARWYSMRLFGRHWRVALAAVLSLSVALAAVTIGLAAYRTALMRPAGVGHAEALQFIHTRTSANAFDAMSYEEFLAYRERARSFTDVAAFPYWISTGDLAFGDRHEAVLMGQVSTNYFAVLDVRPMLGSLRLRALPDDDVDGVVIGERLWRRLGADPAIVGTTATVNGASVAIVGVAPQTYRGLLLAWAPNVWISPKTAERVVGSAPSQLTDRTQRWLNLIGRLRPGVTRGQASAEVLSIAAQIAREHSETNRDRTAVLSEVSMTPPGDRGWMATVFGGLVLIVLLGLIVAGTNVTNLLLGLAASRRHEMLIRAALGASRGQLIAPLVREGLVLGLVSGAIGFAAAAAVLRRLATLTLSVGNGWPSPTIDLHLGPGVFAAMMAIAIVVGLAVGLVPALRAASDGLSGAINRERSVSEPRRGRVRGTLVVIQMAVATLVMVGVGLSVRSFLRLEHISLGFSARHLTYASVNLERSGYTEQTGRAFYEDLRTRMAAIPGVQAVTLVSNEPLAGYLREHVFDADGRPWPASQETTPLIVVDANYFTAIGMPILSGRSFDTHDRQGSEEVVIVNATMARRMWPDRSAVDQHLRIGPDHRLARVVGVVPDSKFDDLTESPLPAMYLPLAHRYTPNINVVMRSPDEQSEPKMLGAGVHDTATMPIAQAMLDLGGSRLAWNGGATLDDLIRMSLLLPRAIVAVSIVFGVLTLALALFGLYSTVFYSVNQRRMEMGIRIAIGAQPRDVFTAVLRHTVRVAAIGTIVGVAAGQALLPFASSILYGIGKVEPAVLIEVALVSACVALLTTYVVARPWMRAAVADLLRRT
jgi:predicted permease